MSAVIHVVVISAAAIVSYAAIRAVVVRYVGRNPADRARRRAVRRARRLARRDG